MRGTLVVNELRKENTDVTEETCVLDDNGNLVIYAADKKETRETVS